MKRRFAQAFVLVMAFLILVAEIQLQDDDAAARAADALYGVQP